MWSTIARFILRNRIILLLFVGILTGIMGYNAFKVKLVYEFASLLPESDSTSINYENFKNRFGLDGNVLLLSIEDFNIHNLNQFNDWYDLGESIKSIHGIQEVVSLTRLYNLTKNDSLERFQFKRMLKAKPTSQIQLDSIIQTIYRLPFYEGFIYSRKNTNNVMAITFKKTDLNSKNRLYITDTIHNKAEAFAAKYKLKAHYSGMPYIRTSLQRLVSSEMILFMILSLVVTTLILFLFFRSLLPVLFSLLVVSIGVIFSFGTLALFGFQITVLTGLIPPLIVVIGVPNCILLINKYHVEFARHNIQGLALSRTIKTIGVSLFFANITTAIGFAVFCFTRTKILYEFGLISSLNVFCTYLISIIVIPSVFSFLKPPSNKQTKHIEGFRISAVLEKIDFWVHNYRTRIYIIVSGVVILSLIGICFIRPLGYVVDDLPKNHPIYSDMHYFEKNYNGILPFEISIDSKKENGVFADNGRILYKINSLQKVLAQYPVFSRPVSVAEAVKFSYQAYKDGNPKYYRLPGAIELAKIAQFASDAKDRQNSFKAFIDSTKRYTRVSVQMADIGSVEMNKLVNQLKPRIDSVFNYDTDAQKWLPKSNQTDVNMTGFCIMFLKGNDFLITNLLESVLLAIVLIGLIMFTLFMTGRMVFIALIPSLVPLLLTAGLMGFFHIYLKPSTILIFSIAFGISSDGTLYFLTKYRHDLRQKRGTISDIVSHTIRETGISMIYTAIILSAGFGIFVASKFGGTAALGILVSFTLLTAYASNLILLPCFLLTLEKRLINKAFLEHSLVEPDSEEEIEAKEQLDEVTYLAESDSKKNSSLNKKVENQ